MAEEETTLSPEEKKIEEVQKKIDNLEEIIGQEIRKIEEKYGEQKNSLLRERNEAIKAIPNFWKTTIEKHVEIVDWFSDTDLEILEFIEDLFVDELFEFADGFKITMMFKDGNPYFSNKSIHKSLTYNKEKDEYEMESSKIDWKEGKNLAEENKKEQRGP